MLGRAIIVGATGSKGQALATGAIGVGVAKDILAGIAYFTAKVDADLIDAAFLIGAAIADEIAISAQTDLGCATFGVGRAAVGGDTLSRATKFVGRTIAVGGALQRAADTLALDTALSDGAVKVVVALWRGAGDAALVDADHAAAAVIVA